MGARRLGQGVRRASLPSGGGEFQAREKETTLELQVHANTENVRHIWVTDGILLIQWLQSSLDGRRALRHRCQRGVRSAYGKGIAT
jgi:hypothetical protein